MNEVYLFYALKCKGLQGIHKNILFAFKNQLYLDGTIPKNLKLKFYTGSCCCYSKSYTQTPITFSMTEKEIKSLLIFHKRM